jgi:chemotaxis protein methyltransferase CheR
MAYDYDYFVNEILRLTQIDLSSYKQNQMKRRIDAFIMRHNSKGYEDFVALVRKDKALLEEFVEYITINVSEFYRNPEQWKFLTDEVFPKLIERFGNRLTIWSAACSTGDEPYSLVMALSKYVPLSQIRIIATDLSDEIIEKAKIGMYGQKSLASVPPEYKEKYFKKNGDFYQISDEIKRCVEFKKHNLLKDPFIKQCNLIVCRNVLIYFTEEAKDETFVKFYESLAKGGILFIGSTEQILNYKSIGYVRKSNFFYEKPAD